MLFRFSHGILLLLFWRCLVAYPRRSDLAIILDVSKSISRDGFTDTIEFIQQHLYSKSISPGTTRIGLITFSSKAYLKFTFEKYVNREGLYKRLKRLQFRPLSGKTNIDSALRKALYLFKNHRGFARRKQVYIFSDGKWNYGNDPTKSLNALKRMGIKTFVFAVGKRPYVWNLIWLASSPTKTHYFRLSRDRKQQERALARLERGSDVYGLCSKPGKHKDECGRHCTCIDGILTDCARVRKEFTSLLWSDRKRYIKAYLKLTTTEPLRSRFVKYISKHQQYFWLGIHEPKQFYPWHRWYIYKFENMLKEVDCRITLPFWDWSYYSDVAWKRGQHIWREDEYGFGGNGHENNTFCVETGPFKDGVWKAPAETKQSYVIDTSYQMLNQCKHVNGTKIYAKCLRRSFNHKPVNVSHVLNTVNLPCSSTDLFNYRSSGYHNDIHNFIGGDMCTNYAANAPEFFLHHGFLDSIWYRWQQHHPECASTYYRKYRERLLVCNLKKENFVDSHNQGENVNIQYEDFLKDRLDPKVYGLVVKIDDTDRPLKHICVEESFDTPFSKLNNMRRLRSQQKE